VPSGSVGDLGNAVLGGQVGSLRPGCPGGGVDAGIGRGGPVDSRAVQAFDVAGYVVDDDAERVDVDAVWQFLSTQAYWGRWRRREDVAAQVRSAWRVVGVYRCDSGALVGFARAVSDGVSLAYLADVFITPRPPRLRPRKATGRCHDRPRCRGRVPLAVAHRGRAQHVHRVRLCPG